MAQMVKERMRGDVGTASASSSTPSTAASEGVGTHPAPSHLPPYKFPKIVERAYRTSTRTILKQVLIFLERQPNRTAEVNISAISRKTGYHRKTVARALDFGERFRVIECVNDRTWSPTKGEIQPGSPKVYRSHWKLLSSKRAPSPYRTPTRYKHQQQVNGLRPSREYKKAAMRKIRAWLYGEDQGRLVAAYGMDGWSKGATRLGIATLAKDPSIGVTERVKELPTRDAFGLCRYLISKAVVGLDNTERYTASLKKEALPEDFSTRRLAQSLANENDYVTYTLVPPSSPPVKASPDCEPASRRHPALVTGAPSPIGGPSRDVVIPPGRDRHPASSSRPVDPRVQDGGPPTRAVLPHGLPPREDATSVNPWTEIKKLLRNTKASPDPPPAKVDDGATAARAGHGEQTKTEWQRGWELVKSVLRGEAKVDDRRPATAPLVGDVMDDGDRHGARVPADAVRAYGATRADALGPRSPHSQVGDLNPDGAGGRSVERPRTRAVSSLAAYALPPLLALPPAQLDRGALRQNGLDGPQLVDLRGPRPNNLPPKTPLSQLDEVRD